MLQVLRRCLAARFAVLGLAKTITFVIDLSLGRRIHLENYLDGLILVDESPVITNNQIKQFFHDILVKSNTTMR